MRSATGPAQPGSAAPATTPRPVGCPRPAATYTLTPTTKVHKGKQTATTPQITTNDRVRILATKTGTTDTATHIGDAGPTQ